MWGIDATATVTFDDGQVTVFAAVDHCTAECVGIHAVKRATRFEALEPIRQGRLVKILERPAGQRFAPFQGLLESGIAVGYVFLPGAQFVACSSPRSRFEPAVRTPGGPVARHPQPKVGSQPYGAKYPGFCADSKGV